MRFSAIAWRSLAARPLRTILTALGVALGVAIVGATLTANEASSRALERAAAQVLGSADLRVRAFNDAGFSPRAVTSADSVGSATAVGAARAHRGPALIEFRVEQEDSVFPMVPAGASLHEMIRRPSPIVETGADT